ncbi:MULTISPECIES: tyrosine-type recombinase/integrase [unclassified Sulfitobacter]|uniref:tyrosine-type recombinase/integrase n=1 Tax=unclassified Sulfitobacter TaxID=196795 RepID=UPI0007C207C9|nr:MULTISPECIES: site-specific integrase [unclassified Sulfitobacter]KZX95407.1 integrase [Sulfitobacter sp. HI0027]KZX97978.1 integrase [Sulfitobacter sp. HI0021]KZZ03167.1 integrase [Sulfitobacter sp. HI0076]
MADIRRRETPAGVTYQVRYQSRSTKSGYQYKTFHSLKAARAFLESGKTQAATETTHPEIDTVAKAADWWLRICEKEGLNGREPVTYYTLKNYSYRARFIEDYDWKKGLRQITAPDVVAFRSWLLQSGVSRSLASKVLSVLHSIMKEMTIRGVIPYNVASGISIRQESRYTEPVTIPSKNDVMALLNTADALAASTNAQTARTWQRYRPILYLAADSGMRPQEYLALSRSSICDKGVSVDRAIDGSGRTISVTKTKAGRRFIDLSPETVAMLRHYVEHHSVPNDYDLVFPAQNGKWMCRKNWQRRGFNVACVEAGLTNIEVINGKKVEKPRYRPYDLRHFFASMLIERQLNLKKIQSLMGHNSIETTLNVYGHLLEDGDDDKITNVGMLGTLLN